MNNNNKPNCYECIYRGGIPGDAHSKCNYSGTKTGFLDLHDPKNREVAAKLNIKAHPTGIRRGWFLWPINFNPVWLENCDGFTPEDKAENI